jgi:hypothetical protein
MPDFSGLDMPERIAQLPRDHRGFPIPWFVSTLEDGSRDFRVADGSKAMRAARKNLCWICGKPGWRKMTFVVGPMCAINRTSSEPPSHGDCARFAARACPFLARPRMKRNERNLPEGSVEPAGQMIRRNPGVALLWHVTRFGVFPDGRGGFLFDMLEPTGGVEWFAEGRPAMRAEVEHSITTGLPALREVALQDGPEGLAELERRRLAILPLIPQA